MTPLCWTSYLAENSDVFSWAQVPCLTAHAAITYYFISQGAIASSLSGVFCVPGSWHWGSTSNARSILYVAALIIKLCADIYVVCYMFVALSA